MAISNAYPKGIPVEDADLFVGSKAYTNRTVNYTAQGIADYLNINAKVSIGGQMTFKFSVVPNMPKTIAFEGGFGDNTPFADITRLVVSGSDGSGSDITIFLDYLVDSKILLAQQNQPNNFGHYKILSYTQIGITDFYNLDLEYIGGNGNIADEIYYDMVSFSLVAGSGGSQNLQQVTDIGSTTTNTITAAALVAGNFTSDGFMTYISDAYDGFWNFSYIPFTGLTITDGINSIFIGQDASITFINNVGGYGNLRMDNVTGVTGAKVWQFPDASGTLALTSDITTPTLQQVLDNNHDLVGGNFFAGTSAGDSNSGTLVIAIGDDSALANSGGSVNALGYRAGYSNSASSLNAFGSGSGALNSGYGVNALGDGSGAYNLGNYVNALGINAGVVALEVGNPFNNVNLFGLSATADEDGQTVLSKDGTIMARISTTNLTASRKYTLQDDSGILALLSDIPSYSVPTLDDVLQAGNVTQRGMQIKFINWFSLLGGYAQLNGELCTTGNSPIYQFQNKATGSYQLATLDDIPTGGGTVTSVDLTMPAAFTVSGNPITSSGTLAVTAAGSASQYVRGDGQLATLPSNASGGSAISYYLNGGTAASVATYYQMSKTAVIGTGVDFSLAGNGLISQWLTDVADPNRLEIPAGNWNFEMYMSASSSGGTPAFYVELLKYDGVTFTTIANSSVVPEAITSGTLIDLYLTSLAIPYTTLTVADRLAVRVYIVNSTGGRTITMHTQDSHLCQIITNFAGGIAALNGLSANTQYLAVGTTGTDFAISSISDTHTFNLPTASATNRGALSSADWSTFSGKENALTFSTGLTRTTNTVTNNLSTGIAGGQSIIGGTASGNNLTLSSTSNATKGKLLFGTSAYDEVNNYLGITNTTPTSKLHIITNNVGITQNNANGIILDNQTPASSVSGAGLQYSPPLVFVANGYSSPTNYVNKFMIDVVPTFGASGSSSLRFRHDTNGSIATLLTLLNNGGLSITGTFSSFGAIVNDSYRAGAATSSITSGIVNDFYTTRVFSPTSGTGVANIISLAPTINQTGGANGITRGLYVAPALTAAADFRAIESTNGKVLLTDTFSAGSGALAGSLLDLRQTWNTTGSPTAIKLNVTNTTSGASSLLMDLQVGGVSQFNLTKAGILSIAGNFGCADISSSGVISGGRTIKAGGSSSTAFLQNGFMTDATYPKFGVTSGQGGTFYTNATVTHSTGTFQWNGLGIYDNIIQTGTANGITRGIYINPTLTSVVDFRAIEVTAGKIVYSSTITASGTTGAQTINKISGKVNAAAASTSLVVTNSLVTASSIVMCQLGTNDATCDIKSVVEAAGSFTINYTAPTAETVIKFTVIN